MQTFKEIFMQERHRKSKKWGFLEFDSRSEAIKKKKKKKKQFTDKDGGGERGKSWQDLQAKPFVLILTFFLLVLLHKWLSGCLGYNLCNI